jgi:glyoxylase-like metal-dependent hydrolase (beta-lactamase superfamily II)
VYGNYLFTEADIISSEKCREILRKSGEKNLNEAKQSTPELADVVLRLPNLTFPDKMTFQLGDRILKLVPLPGHTLDGIGIYIEGEKILFAGDAVMALPHIYRQSPRTRVSDIPRASIPRRVRPHQSNDAARVRVPRASVSPSQCPSRDKWCANRRKQFRR